MEPIQIKMEVELVLFAPQERITATQDKRFALTAPLGLLQIQVHQTAISVLLIIM
jgi:hypothetical protein